MLAGALALAGCSSNSTGSGEGYSPRVVKLGQPVPPGGGAFKIGRTYSIKGRAYTPVHQPDYDEVGYASWYGRDFQGRLTANGEIYNMESFSAAHKTLPLPVYARVTNLENGRSVVVRINDRGPFARDRIIDLSKKTAEVLGFTHQGTAKVRVQYVGRAPLDGEDKWLTTTVRNDGTSRQVADIDRELAERAFAADGSRGAGKQRYRMAASAYRGRRLQWERDPLPRQTMIAAASPSGPVPQPVATTPAPAAAGTQPLGTPVTFASADAGRIVQAGVFRDPANAYAVAARLAEAGIVSVESVAFDGATAYRVAVRPRSSSDSIETVLARTRLAGVDAAVTRVY